MAETVVIVPEMIGRSVVYALYTKRTRWWPFGDELVYLGGFFDTRVEAEGALKKYQDALWLERKVEG